MTAPTPGTFQTPAPLPYLNGAVSVELLDPDTGTSPLIIRSTDAFEIKVSWSLDGSLANLIGGLSAMWHLTVVADPLEAPTPLVLGKCDKAMADEESPVPNLPREYVCKLAVAPGTMAPGLYQLAAYVVFDDGFGLSYGMTGFVEIPIFEIVKAP
jgi:hypothetical protein